LRRKGLRVTPQRLAILQILEESGEHLDAETLLTRARNHVPKLSLATVYRTLKILKDVGLVSQQGSDAGQVRTSFETTNKKAHYHFVCLACGQVIEIPTTLLDQAAQELARRWGALLTGANLEGTCRDCKAGEDS
jgi:Fe2+ or Zn2+ uptake regulation protein